MTMTIMVIMTTMTMILNFYDPVYMALVQIEVGISYFPVTLFCITEKPSRNGIKITKPVYVESNKVRYFTSAI